MLKQVAWPLIAFISAASLIVAFGMFFFSSLLPGTSSFYFALRVFPMIVTRLIFAIGLPLLFFATALKFSRSSAIALVMAYLAYIFVEQVAIGSMRIVIPFHSALSATYGYLAARVVVWAAIIAWCYMSAGRRFELLITRR
jgi:hypothetical protein